METSMWVTLSAIVTAVAIFVSKSLWNYAVARQSELDKQTLKRKLDLIATQLSSFYWPLYIRLEKDNTVWRRILGVEAEEGSLRQRLGKEFEVNVVIPNHLECVRVIQSKIHLSQADPQFLHSLMHYIDHVALYKALRDAGESKTFPYQLECPFPEKLIGEVKERTLKLQAEYNRLIHVTFEG